jgi:hypothetical protein
MSTPEVRTILQKRVVRRMPSSTNTVKIDDAMLKNIQLDMKEAEAELLNTPTLAADVNNTLHYMQVDVKLTPTEASKREIYYPIEILRSKKIEPYTYHINVERQDLFWDTLSAHYKRKYPGKVEVDVVKLFEMQHELLDQNSRHFCFYDIKPCEMLNHKADEIYFSRTLNQHMRSTGRVFVCQPTGFVHPCDDNCLGVNRGEFRVCPFSNIVKQIITSSIPVMESTGGEDSSGKPTRTSMYVKSGKNSGTTVMDDYAFDVNIEGYDQSDRYTYNMQWEEEIQEHGIVEIERTKYVEERKEVIRHNLLMFDANVGVCTEKQIARSEIVRSEAETALKLARKDYLSAVHELMIDVRNEYTYVQFITDQSFRQKLALTAQKIVTNFLFSAKHTVTDNTSLTSRITNTHCNLVMYFRTCIKDKKIPNYMYAYTLYLNAMNYTRSFAPDTTDSSLPMFYQGVFLYYWSKLAPRIYANVAKTQAFWLQYFRKFVAGLLKLMLDGYNLVNEDKSVVVVISKDTFVNARTDKNKIGSEQGIGRDSNNAKNIIIRQFNEIANEPGILQELLFSNARKIIYDRVRNREYATEEEDTEPLFC